MAPDALRRVFAPAIDAVRVPFDASARAMLDALVNDVAARVGDDPAELAFARSNLDVLLGDLVQQCRILRFDVIPPAALVSVLERRCPLWPFCGERGSRR